MSILKGTLMSHRDNGPRFKAAAAVAFFGLLLLGGCASETPPPEEEQLASSAADQPMGTAETADAPDKVLVFGATGRTGRRVVAQLLERGYDVRAFVRNEESAREKLGANVEYVTGDVREAESVVPAFEGVTGVVSAIGSSGRAKDPSNTPEAVDYEGVKLLAESAASANVRHFVLVSSMGVTIEDHPLNKMFDNVLKWKFKGEEALRGSGVPYTIVRPGGLTEEPGGDSEVRIFSEDEGEGMIPRADVAAVCVAALGNPSARNKTFSIVSGTGELSPDFDAAFAGIAADP